MEPSSVEKLLFSYHSFKMLSRGQRRRKTLHFKRLGKIGFRTPSARGNGYRLKTRLPEFGYAWVYERRTSIPHSGKNESKPKTLTRQALHELYLLIKASDNRRRRLPPPG